MGEAFPMPDAAALSRVQLSQERLTQKQPETALGLAREAVAIAPNNLLAQTALGNASAAAGNAQEARTAWQAALQTAQQLEPDAQPSYVPNLQAKIKKLAR